MKVVNGHLVLTGSDRGLFRIPDNIKDQNGDVVLDLCVICGKGEAELNEACEPKHSLAPFRLGSNGWCDDHHIDLDSVNHGAIAQILTSMDHKPSNTPRQLAELQANANLLVSSPFLLDTMKDLFVYVDGLKKLELNNRATPMVLEIISSKLLTAISYAVSGKLP